MLKMSHTLLNIMLEWEILKHKWFCRRLKNDFVDVLTCCENQTLDKIDFHFDMKTYTNVVLASGGYPEKYEKGKLITGLDNVSESTIFHAGTIKKDNNIYTNGGRVLSIVSSALK